jgi:hypothetical protein
MAQQCLWCGSFSGQAIWKIVGGVLGGKDGKARRIVRLKVYVATFDDGSGVDRREICFCSKAEADQWKESLGKRFIRWEKP